MDFNKIYLGDAYELIKQIPDKTIDLIYTDPPYEFRVGTGGAQGMFKDRALQPLGDVEDANLNTGIDYSILDQFVRVLKAVNIFIWCNKSQVPNYLNYFLKIPNISFEILTWHKKNCTPFCKNVWLPDTEYCLYFREKGAVTLNDGYNLKRKYFVTNTNKDDKDDYLHPTVKPIEFVEKHILHTTQEKQVVLDPFLGSGTTALACKHTNRQYIGFEINEKFYNIAKDRLCGINQRGELNIFDIE